MGGDGSHPASSGESDPVPAAGASADAKFGAKQDDAARQPSIAGTTASAARRIALSAGPPATPGAGSFKLDFEVTGQQGASPLAGGYGELEWTQDGERYDARLALKLAFLTLRTWRSVGRVGVGGFEPDRFTDRRRREASADFDRARGVIVFSNRAPSAALLPGAQDRLSVMLQLGAVLAADPAGFAAGSSLAVQTVGTGDGAVWVFDVHDTDTLQLIGGEQTALRLSRRPRRPGDDVVEVWFAPALDWLPVRIKLTQADGDFADFRMRNLARRKAGE